MILFEEYPLFGPVVFFILGTILGSFANVVILRNQKGQSFVTPGSHCPQCQAPIGWQDNIPILSWIFLRGRCRNCSAKISIRYLIVELLTGALFAMTVYRLGYSWFLIEALILVLGLVIVSFIDLDSFLLPDVFTLPGMALGLFGGLINPERSFWDALLGFLMGGGFLWAVAYFYYLWRKEEGMGGGDIKLLAWIGAVLGWQSIPFVIISASIVGAVAGLWAASSAKQGLKTVIPFGPYLALGAVFYMLGGHDLAERYIEFFFPYF